MGPFVNDPTLRKGDIVVTRVGVRVFQGRQADEYAAKDFVALSNANAANLSHVFELTQIEQSNRQYVSRFAAAGSAPNGAIGKLADATIKTTNFVILQVHGGHRN
jgi:hypothetical protein